VVAVGASLPGRTLCADDGGFKSIASICVTAAPQPCARMCEGVASGSEEPVRCDDLRRRRAVARAVRRRFRLGEIFSARSRCRPLSRPVPRLCVMPDAQLSDSPAAGCGARFLALRRGAGSSHIFIEITAHPPARRDRRTCGRLEYSPAASGADRTARRADGRITARPAPLPAWAWTMEQ